MGAIIEGAITEVEALEGINEGDTVDAISKAETSGAVGAINVGEVVGIITEGETVGAISELLQKQSCYFDEVFGYYSCVTILTTQIL